MKYIMASEKNMVIIFSKNFKLKGLIGVNFKVNLNKKKNIKR